MGGLVCCVTITSAEHFPPLISPHGFVATTLHAPIASFVVSQYQLQHGAGTMLWVSPHSMSSGHGALSGHLWPVRLLVTLSSAQFPPCAADAAWVPLVGSVAIVVVPWVVDAPPAPALR